MMAINAYGQMVFNCVIKYTKKQDKV